MNLVADDPDARDDDARCLLRLPHVRPRGRLERQLVRLEVQSQRERLQHGPTHDPRHVDVFEFVGIPRGELGDESRFLGELVPGHLQPETVTQDFEGLLVLTECQ